MRTFSFQKVVLALILLMPTPSLALEPLAGDLTVLGGALGGQPFTPTQSAKVSKAKQILQTIDPQAVSEIDAALQSGQLGMGELTSPLAKGASDGNTMLIKTDGQPATVVALRLAHEFMHWKYGANGILDGCNHAGVWAQTLVLQQLACLAGVPVGCDQVLNTKQQYQDRLADCPSGVPINPATGLPFTFDPGLDVCCLP